MEGIEYPNRSDSASDTSTIPGDPAPIENLEQLLILCTLPTTNVMTGNSQTCNICTENFHDGPNPESPLQLPKCDHVFGKGCITTWISDGNNTCPMCRKPILDIPEGEEDDNDADNDDELQFRVELARWHPAWDINEHEADVPTAWARRGEELFSDLCEAIVSWIEDPSILEHPMPAEEWLCGREPFKTIVACATFQGFCAIFQAPECYPAVLTARLVHILPNRTPIDLIMDHVPRPSEYLRHEYMEADEHTHERLADWYRRIRLSRDILGRCLDARAAANTGMSSEIDSETDETSHADEDDESDSYDDAGSDRNVGHARPTFDEGITMLRSIAANLPEILSAYGVEDSDHPRGDDPRNYRDMSSEDSTHHPEDALEYYGDLAAEETHRRDEDLGTWRYEG